MAVLEELRPTERLLVMDLVAEAGLDVSDWANYAGKHPASNPRYCYEWVFTQNGMPSVACLWFGNLELAVDGSLRQRLNLWQVAKKHESLPGRSAVAKRARTLDVALQTAFRKQSPVRVIVVDGEQADLVVQNAQSSKVERRRLDPAAWTVAEYDWSTGDCLLVRNEARLDGGIRAHTEGSAQEPVPTYITRLAYNSHHWRRPATAAEVQEAGDTYRNENGFGHEDWLFRNEWELDGWRYAFVQGVNKSRAKLLRESKPFNLRLFTMPAPGDRRAVAEIRDAECLDDETAIAAVAAYERIGWLDIMRAEVAAAGGRPEALDETSYAPHILNFRFRIGNLSMLDADTPLPPDDPVHRLKRYGLYGTAGAMIAAVDSTGKPVSATPFETLPLSPGEYRQAFDRIEMSDNQRRWLVAHHYSPDATTSMLQLASALGYADHRAANGAYSALGRKVADALPRAPDDLEDGEYVDWLQALAQIVEPDALNHSQWRLREEVVQAMLEMGWVEARDATDIEVVESPTPDDQRLARDYGLDDTQIRQMMLSRRGQGRFRNETLRFWGGRCAVSGLPDICFLVASHIKPWKDANPNERLDGFNGLPLTPNLDRAFDRGYVSFAEDGSIMISPALSVESMQALGIRPDMALRICDERLGTYMAYHREHVFVQ
ncbi:HNH endonuclease [Xanthomonas campestris]|uniref:HNH endonuclease n=1 Tax=Xanthomonas campestris TaxID=339 RepID=UPI002368BAF4|nr:HNH endonuclease [Xanthomonas campestris]WDI95509.1 HNH endonuclease [Xanthomonas campestris]